ncbi:acyl-CoA synthetase [Novosphingobium sp. PS1R-30]|uniref:Acyl-CoA synthetase n=1 Tax=Novosphingobium anseongense TaxID=3133436 RepID=A0ABU8S1F1_9SPHN
MHSAAHARSTPDKLALILPDRGMELDFRTLEALSNQTAHLLRAKGLKRGDVVAALFDNGPEVFILGAAAQRAGLYLTSISTKVSAGDIAYILEDSDARILIASDENAALAREANAASDRPLFAWSFSKAGVPSWSELAAKEPETPIADESAGTDMLYSSGTTGRPKGIKFPLPDGPVDEETSLMAMGRTLYGMGPDTVYLSTSPLYHAAPLRWALAVVRMGGTVVVMERFDAARTLELIERFKITHATFVPTHFVRMLKLPENVRARADVSSLEAVIHAAAPCPVPVKQAMLDWWGPIVHEYYAGTETCGITSIGPVEWLEKPGSVGRAVVGTLRITDDEANPLPAGQTGNVCFADGPRFEYHKDPERTAQAYDRNGYASMGDIGRVDDDGYLYLTDRKSFMIISGGVNIYPQEIENCLTVHPKVADVAVIGIPDDEMGERVLAVVQPAPGVVGTEGLADELQAYARQHLGGVKAPRHFAFREDLPREPTGKLMKRRLVEEFRPNA